MMQFVSLIPQMDKEVAIAIINQFPSYSEYAVSMIEQLNIMCNNILKNNAESQKDAIEAYKVILETIKTQSLAENITPEMKLKLNQQMIDVADKIAAKDSENKRFLRSLYGIGAGVIGSALLLGAVILGVSSKSHDIPSLDDIDTDIKPDDFIDTDFSDE